MFNSVRPQRRQPTRLPRPWDSPGKNTGVGCHFLLQCMKRKSESEVAQSYPTLSDPMDCSLPGSSAHGIFQARVLEWGAIAFLGRFIPRYFICLVAVVNGIVSFIFLSDLFLLAYRNAGVICVLILYLPSLLNSLMSSHNFLVASL